MLYTGSISSLPRVCHVLPPTLFPSLHHISSLPKQNCQPHSLTGICRTPALCFKCPSTKWKPLPYTSDLLVSETAIAYPSAKSKWTKEGWQGERPRQGLRQLRPLCGCIASVNTVKPATGMAKKCEGRKG